MTIDKPEMFCKKNLLTRKQQLERKKKKNCKQPTVNKIKILKAMLSFSCDKTVEYFTFLQSVNYPTFRLTVTIPFSEGSDGTKTFFKAKRLSF